MITYLRLENFRRHESTELFFEDSHQVVLFSGSNGVGKSTIFEAVLFALYGEGRNGRAGIEKLVRKGSDLEGMEVEVEFVLGDSSYRVRRRRDNKLTSAVLYGNGVAITEGPREVTYEITKILGMDSKGFKLASYAQQKELDGLASMRAGERGKIIAKLLRLDVLTRAKEAARAEFNEHKSLVGRMAISDETAPLYSEQEGLQTQIKALDKALIEVKLSIAKIENDLLSTSAVDEQYNLAKDLELQARGSLDGLQKEIVRVEADLCAISVPEPLSEPPILLSAVHELITENEKRIAAAEALKRESAQAKSHKSEIAICEKKLKETKKIAEVAEPDLVGHAKTMELKEASVDALSESLLDLRQSFATVSEKLSSANDKLKNISGLDAQCYTCGQTVDLEHKNSQVKSIRSLVHKLEKKSKSLEKDILEAESSLDKSRTELELARQEFEECKNKNRSISEAKAQIKDLERRIAVHSSSLGRLEEGYFDLEVLYTARTELFSAKSSAEAYQARENERLLAFEKKVILEKTKKDLQEAFSNAEQNLEKVKLREDLKASYYIRKDLEAQKQVELDLLRSIKSDLGVSRVRAESVSKEIDRAKKDQSRKKKVEEEAQIALYSSKVLGDLENEWSQQIKPSLEGAVSDLLFRLSEGRFDSVSFDDDYNVKVNDYGTSRGLEDLSGGECDLVALAVRLGLAGVVGDRQGTGGAGFLILDECFGSQDGLRRESILSSLRNLRSSYGQIFLISHVGGIEDSADKVFEISLNEEKIALVESL